ncbi:osmoprotectant NAGGN system M42 family peptidase [Brevundimonas sp.]|uniref:osmoprotectant NAGGN system M42 family peptidase n=1 Tax=Brevundimonas sp. TaxID=1871086 RepID=UPI0025DD6AF9|nr:osmoprotectant NAGGN system M42 family peptidase [Brevundimonas sp.]
MTKLDIDVDYLSGELKRLLSVDSPSGYTDEVVWLACREIDRLGYGFELTRRGAIRAVLRGEKRRPARSIVAHLDTLGAQVKSLKPNGRLEVVPIGHWSSRFAEGARCTVYSDAGSYRGTILPLKASGHTFNEEVDTQPTGWPYVELRIDALAETADDLGALGIAIGDIIGIDPQPEFLENGFVVSRHLDNKAGVACLLAAMEAMSRAGLKPEVDTYFLFTVNEEVGVGASSVMTPDIASLVSIDNGTTAPGQNSREFGVTVSMADQTGPFDWHLTRKLVRLCQDNDIAFQKDVFRYYRSDAASAIEAGADIRTALITFGIDASHGYERIHLHALRSVAELVTAYVASPIEIPRDAERIGGLGGFTHQPHEPAEQDASALE